MKGIYSGIQIVRDRPVFDLGRTVVPHPASITSFSLHPQVQPWLHVSQESCRHPETVH